MPSARLTRRWYSKHHDYGTHEIRPNERQNRRSCEEFALERRARPFRRGGSPGHHLAFRWHARRVASPAARHPEGGARRHHRRARRCPAVRVDERPTGNPSGALRHHARHRRPREARGDAAHIRRPAGIEPARRDVSRQGRHRLGGRPYLLNGAFRVQRLRARDSLRAFRRRGHAYGSAGRGAQAHRQGQQAPEDALHHSQLPESRRRHHDGRAPQTSHRASTTS